MALTPEDGTGLPTADTYITVAEYDFYAARIGKTIPQSSEEEKEQALRRAVQALDSSYNWKGRRSNRDQSLAWPRAGVVDSDGFAVEYNRVPFDIKSAQAELALEAANLLPTLPAGSDGLTKLRQKADVVEEEKEWGSGTNNPYPVYTAANRLVAPYVTSGSHVLRS